MKKVLFASALLAFMASCTENELDSLPASKQNNGISFVAEQAPMTRMQWDETETSYVPFWYAEQDRIGIFAANVKTGAFSSEQDLASRMLTSWQGLPHVAGVADATYKATQSKQSGAFTAVSDADLLHFNGDKEARFLAVYPSTIKANYETKDGAGKIVLSNLPDIASQTQTTVKGNNSEIPMYSMSIASKENSYDAVGEKVNLRFQRPLAALVMKTKNANDYTEVDATTLKSIFGKLTKVTVEAKGYEEAGNDIAPSVLAYDESTATIVVDTLDYTAAFENGIGTGTASKVDLTIGTAGLDWDDNALAIATITKVNRKAFVDKGKKETMEVVFNFENIDLTKTLETNKDWNGFIEVPALDIEEYPYLVTKGTAGSARTLIVNKGKFSDIYNEDKDKVKWTDEHEAGGEVPLANIETIISKVELSNEELLAIKKFTGLKNLTLANNTSMPKGTFDATLGGQIEKLELPKVTEYLDTQAFSKLVNLDINSYEFAENDVYGLLFNSNTKATLKTLKIEGMTSMRPTFGYDRTITFQDFTVLESVALNPVEVALTSNAFNGCTALKSVTGVMDITNAPSAFEDAGAQNFAVNVSTTIIPSKAFKGAKISSVLKDGAVIVPTEIGASAFEGNTAIEEMDLSKATTIGKAAFKGATSFVGTKTNRNVVNISVKEINDEILSGTAVVRVQFLEATKIGSDVFGTSTPSALKQIKFLKNVGKLVTTPVASASTPFENTTLTNVDLFVSMAQADVEDLEWLGGTFKSITREDKVFE